MEALAGHSADEKAAAINSEVGVTTVLGTVCALADSPLQQDILRLLLSEGGDPNQPAVNPVVCYPITSTHSVATMRQLVNASARLDADSVLGMLRSGHPTLDHGGERFRRYLEEDLGLSPSPPMREDGC